MFLLLQLIFLSFYRLVKDKFMVTCHRIQDKICVRVWALVFHSAADDQAEGGSAMPTPLFQKVFEEPNPHPLRTWSIDVDKFQIILSSEIKEESIDPKQKFILTLSFVQYINRKSDLFESVVINDISRSKIVQYKLSNVRYYNNPIYQSRTSYVLRLAVIPSQF